MHSTCKQCHALYPSDIGVAATSNSCDIMHITLLHHFVLAHLRRPAYIGGQLVIKNTTESFCTLRSYASFCLPIIHDIYIQSHIQGSAAPLPYHNSLARTGLSIASLCWRIDASTPSGHATRGPHMRACAERPTLLTARRDHTVHPLCRALSVVCAAVTGSM